MADTFPFVSNGYAELRITFRTCRDCGRALPGKERCPLHDHALEHDGRYVIGYDARYPNGFEIRTLRMLPPTEVHHG